MAELQADAAVAKAKFRLERLDEPLDLYNKFYGEFSAIFADIVSNLSTIMSDPVDAKVMAKLLKGHKERKAFRYLAAPPISEDDLEAVADTSIAPTGIAQDLSKATLVRDTMRSILDPHRFPWIAVGAIPTQVELDNAVMASAAMAAAREVETVRRNTSKTSQEKAVKDALKSINLTEVTARDIPMMTAAPKVGEFCGESRLAGTRADVVATLNDGRVMAIECKVSNSSVNSYKRVVHDTGGKAAHWYQQLGKAQVVPCAVLSGVFNPANLQHVQSHGTVYLFWEHRLKDLCDYVKGV